MKDAYYYTSSADKVREIEHFFKPMVRLGILKVPPPGLTEILDTDLTQLIKAKAAAAYRAAQVPVVVEHGAFCFDYLKGLPGVLIRPFWREMGGGLCELVPPGQSRKVTVRSAVCYCDGKDRKIILKEVEGELAPCAQGTGGFHWDPIFIPQGETRTFAEMTLDEKLARSPAGLAYAELRKQFGF